MTLRGKVCEEEKCGLEEFSGDRKRSYRREEGKQGCGFAFANSRAPRESLTLKGELQGAITDCRISRKTAPSMLGLRVSRVRGFWRTSVVFLTKSGKARAKKSKVCIVCNMARFQTSSKYLEYLKIIAE
jgi:hypothetical protein